MSDRFEAKFDTGLHEYLEIEVYQDYDISISMYDGDDRVEAWINPQKAREIAAALLRAAIDAEIGLAKESKQ